MFQNETFTEDSFSLKTISSESKWITQNLSFLLNKSSPAKIRQHLGWSLNIRVGSLQSVHKIKHLPCWIIRGWKWFKMKFMCWWTNSSELKSQISLPAYFFISLRLDGFVLPLCEKRRDMDYYQIVKMRPKQRKVKVWATGPSDFKRSLFKESVPHMDNDLSHKKPHDEHTCCFPIPCGQWSFLQQLSILEFLWSQPQGMLVALKIWLRKYY